MYISYADNAKRIPQIFNTDADTFRKIFFYSTAEKSRKILKNSEKIRKIQRKTKNQKSFFCSAEGAVPLMLTAVGAVPLLLWWRALWWPCLQWWWPAWTLMMMLMLLTCWRPCWLTCCWLWHRHDHCMTYMTQQKNQKVPVQQHCTRFLVLFGCKKNICLIFQWRN